MTNKDLYSTGDYIQYLVIAYNRKESEKNIYVCMYIYNWITLLYTWNLHNIVNQLYLSQ